MAGDYDAMEQVDEYCASLTPVVAMNPARPQLSELRRDDSNLFQKSISLALMRLENDLNVTNTLSGEQTVDLTRKIGKRFYFFRFEEILYVLERGAMGRYGKNYNRLDAEVITGWLDYYDVNERTPQAVALAQSKLDADRLSDAELSKFYDTARHVRTMIDRTTIRTEKRLNQREADYRAFRQQYLAQKQAEPSFDLQPTHDHDPDAARSDAQPERAAETA